MSESEKIDSAKFQVRLYPDTNKLLEEFIKVFGETKSTGVELALTFCLNMRKTEFTRFVDDYINGMFLIIKNGTPLVNIVRRNFISYKKLSNNEMEITYRVKSQGDLWSQAKIEFNLDENQHVEKHLASWTQ